MWHLLYRWYCSLSMYTHSHASHIMCRNYSKLPPEYCSVLCKCVAFFFPLVISLGGKKACIFIGVPLCFKLLVLLIFPKYYLKEQLPTVLEAFTAGLFLSHTNTCTENFLRFSPFSKSNRKLIVKLCNYFCGKRE